MEASLKSLETRQLQLEEVQTAFDMLRSAVAVLPPNMVQEVVADITKGLVSCNFGKSQVPASDIVPPTQVQAPRAVKASKRVRLSRRGYRGTTIETPVLSDQFVGKSLRYAIETVVLQLNRPVHVKHISLAVLQGGWAGTRQGNGRASKTSLASSIYACLRDSCAVEVAGNGFIRPVGRSMGDNQTFPTPAFAPTLADELATKDRVTVASQPAQEQPNRNGDVFQSQGGLPHVGS